MIFKNIIKSGLAAAEMQNMLLQNTLQVEPQF
jgi:hypothetical protein